MLNAADFRLPEEDLYLKKVKKHPALPELLDEINAILKDTDDAAFGSELSRLRREGVRLTRNSRPDIIDATQSILKMFGSSADFEVFACKEATSASENAYAFLEDGRLIIGFENDLLVLLQGDELRATIGHEVGHYLLGHAAQASDPSDPISTILQIYTDMWQFGEVPGQELAELARDSRLSEIIEMTFVLSQLQELSADRIGLLACRNFEATVISEVKLHGGHIGGTYSIEDYLHQSEPATEERDWVWLTHPYGPNRCEALRLFYESDLYRCAVGECGGQSIEHFSNALADLVPLVTLVDYSPRNVPEQTVEDYVLELVLMHKVALVDRRLTKAEERLINMYVPDNLRDEVAVRYRQVSAKLESGRQRLDSYMKKSADKDSRWKTKMVRRFVNLIKADRRIKRDEIGKAAEIAKRIGAKEECAWEFRRAFGRSPYFPWL